MRLALALAFMLCSSWAGSASADDRARRAQVERAITRSARELGTSTLAKQHLRADVARYPGEAILLARYAALLLPLDGREQTQAAAKELLRLVERAETIPSTRLVTQDPESERQVMLHAALAHALLGQLDVALTLATQAGRLQDTRTTLCLRQIASLAVRAEQLALAERALLLARQYVPQDQELAHELALVKLARGDTDEAVTLLAERLASDGNDLSARADLAYAMAAQGRAGEALAVLVGVRAECVRERACALLASRIALEAGRPHEAIGFVELLPDDLDALFLRADAHTRAGQPAAARTAYQRVLALRPDSVRAKLGLEQLPAASEPTRSNQAPR